MLMVPLGAADDTPPLPPDALRFERVSLHQIDLFWDPSGPGAVVTHYEVWRTSFEVGKGFTPAVRIGNVTADDDMTYTDGDVIYLGGYLYHVVAVGPGGRSAPSIPVFIGPAQYPSCAIVSVSYNPPGYEARPECAVP